jgi:hypothetical protein
VDVVHHLSVSPLKRYLSFAAWSLLSFPAIKALLTEPASFFLRGLPVPTRSLWGSLLSLLAVAELPWLYLWTRGAGVLSALGATAVCLAVGSWVALASLNNRLSILCLAAVGLSLLSSNALVWLGVGAPMAYLGVRRLWYAGPELEYFQTRHALSRSAGLALLQTHWLCLWRVGRAQLLRGWCFQLTALALTLVAQQNVEAAQRPQLLFIFWIPALIFSLVGLQRPVLDTVNLLDALTAATDTPRRVNLLSAHALVSVYFAALGLLQAGVVASLQHLSRAESLRLCAANLGLGFVLAYLLFAACALLAVASRRRQLYLLLSAGAALVLAERLVADLDQRHLALGLVGAALGCSLHFIWRLTAAPRALRFQQTC